MTIETSCPACGAPLVFSGQQDEVSCTFCGAALHISQEDGQAHFRVISQPGPQKEVLSQPVETAVPIEPDGTAEVYQALEEADEQAHEAQARTAPEPANWSLLDSTPAANPGQAAVYSTPTARSSSGASRWIIIAFSIIMGLILTCACLGFVGFALFRAGR